MIDPALLARLRGRFALDWNGTHGGRHWGRVREVGVRLASLTGARPHIVELFAVFHDSQRSNEWHDPDHGPRAARLVRRMGGRALGLEPVELGLLEIACRDHSDGLLRGDITVQTCWDADRLDLGRIGVLPAPSHLCTEAARDPALIEWAHRRARSDADPDEPLDPIADAAPGLIARLRAAVRHRRG